VTTEEHPREPDVRRLLAAAARPAPPIPEDVAARLDARLAALTGPRATDQSPAAATDETEEPGAAHTARPARRRWPQLLVAAAAVSVLGLGLGNLLGGSMSEESSQPTAGSAAEDRGDPEANTEGRGADSQAPGASTLREDSSGPAGNRPVRLRTRSLAADVQLVEDFELAIPAGPDARSEDACVPPPTTPGTAWLPVLLDGEPALLVLGVPRDDGRRLAEVYPCDDPGSPAATTTVLVR
jgi:hypothetical protein